jgi:hypothetical protein
MSPRLVAICVKIACGTLEPDDVFMDEYMVLLGAYHA